MGQVKATTTCVAASFETTFRAVTFAVQASGLTIHSLENPVLATGSLSWPKNHHLLSLSAGVRPEGAAWTLIDWSVDMIGDKHFEVIDEMVDVLKNVEPDDHGAVDAIQGLSKAERFSLDFILRIFPGTLRPDEQLVYMTRGQYRRGLCLLVLTTSRVFSFVAGPHGSDVMEFELDEACSIGRKQKGVADVEIAISSRGRIMEVSNVPPRNSRRFIYSFYQVRAKTIPPLSQRSHFDPVLRKEEPMSLADDRPISVFISHNHADKPFARSLYDGLQKIGFRVWLDEHELRIGDSMITVISEAIDRIDFVVALISATSVNSSWCQRELALAMSGEIGRRHVMVLPLQIDQTPMPASLKDKLYLQVSRAAPEEAVRELTDSIRRHIKPRPGLPPRISAP